MVRDGQLAKDGFRFQLIGEQPTFDATVYINAKGLGSAHIDGQTDLLLPERELRLVFNGDRVTVRQSSVDRKGKAWGFITEVLQRRVKQVIGKLNVHDGEYFYSQVLQMPISLFRLKRTGRARQGQCWRSSAYCN